MPFIVCFCILLNFPIECKMLILVIADFIGVINETFSNEKLMYQSADDQVFIFLSKWHL